MSSRLRLVICLALVGLCACNNAIIDESPYTANAVDESAAIGDKPFLQSPSLGHLLSIEAESFHTKKSGTTGHLWQISTAMAGESGASYLEVTPNSGATRTFDAVNSASVSFLVRLVVDGPQFLWIRSAACGSGSDSVHVALNGVALVTNWSTPLGCEWTWSKRNITVPDPGFQELAFVMHKDGFKLDKIVLTDNPNFTPTGLGPAESGRIPVEPSPAYGIRGTLSGLAAGTSVVIRNNGTDALTLTGNATFMLPTKLGNLSPYSIAVATQPSGQTCAVSNGQGTISGANVSNVTVSCLSGGAPAIDAGTPAPDAGTPSGSTAFHPGHYFMPLYNQEGGIVNRTTFFNAINNNNFRGAQLRYDWLDFETNEDTYDFSKLDADLASLGPNKYLFILFEVRTNKVTPAHAVPAYMRTSAYGGGEIAWAQSVNQSTPKGYFVNLPNAAARTRLQKLVSKMAEHLATRGTLSKIEGLGFVETSMGYPLAGKPAFDEVGHFNGYVSALQFFNTSFPGRVNYQFLNWPRSRLNIVASQLCPMASGLGTPDTFLEEDGLTMAGFPDKQPYQGLYQYYEQMQGEVPLIASVQPQNFMGNRHPKENPTFEPTLQQLRNYAVNTLHANYLIWTMAVAHWEQYEGITYTHKPTGYAYWADVITFMQQPAQSSTPSGGLSAVKPSCLQP